MTQAEHTSSSGNTKTQTREKTRSRKYFITFWEKGYPRELPDKARYMCTCEDETKTGKWHGHAFIYFKNPVAMSRIKKLFGDTAHLEYPMKNSDCIDYVLNKNSKKHDFQEFGKRPMNNGITMKVYELKNCNEPDELDWYLYNTWYRLHNEPKKIKVNDWKKNIKVYYIWGKSKTGKSDMVEEILRKENVEEFEEVKHINQFWDGIINGYGACVYDDWRDSHMKASEFINFIDYRTHNLNIKGGSVRNNYNLIIISTVQDPEMIYNSLGDEPKKQWLRRMEIIHTIDDGRDEKIPDDCI